MANKHFNEFNETTSLNNTDTVLVYHNGSVMKATISTLKGKITEDIGMTIVTLIGVFQYFKLDFFKTDFGKHLILNPSWWSNLEALNFNMLEGTSYTTLYNPNFLSFYFGMFYFFTIKIASLHFLHFYFFYLFYLFHSHCFTQNLLSLQMRKLGA